MSMSTIRVAGNGSTVTSHRTLTFRRAISCRRAACLGHLSFVRHARHDPAWIRTSDLRRRAPCRASRVHAARSIILTSAYPRPAPRPANSSLNTWKRTHESSSAARARHPRQSSEANWVPLYLVKYWRLCLNGVGNELRTTRGSDVSPPPPAIRRYPANRLRRRGDRSLDATLASVVVDTAARGVSNRSAPVWYHLIDPCPLSCGCVEYDAGRHA